MRKPRAVLAFTVAFAIGGWSAADADTISLTGGSLQFYLGDPGSANLIGAGFNVASTANGGWPFSVLPGGQVDFSTDVGLYYWGPALVDGVRLRGDTSGPGAGRLWIAGTIHVAAVPFIAPPPSQFTGFQAPVTLSGSVAGYFNTDLSQPPLFKVNIAGSGTATGSYRLIDNNGSPFYLNNCCSSVEIADQPPPSPNPEPASMILLGTGMIGFLSRRAWRRRRSE